SASRKSSRERSCPAICPSEAAVERKASGNCSALVLTLTPTPATTVQRSPSSWRDSTSTPPNFRPAPSEETRSLGHLSPAATPRRSAARAAATPTASGRSAIRRAGSDGRRRNEAQTPTRGGENQ